MAMKPLLIVALVVVVCVAVGIALLVKVNQVMGKDVVHEPGTAQPLAADATTKPVSPLAFTMKDIDGKDYDLSQLKGKVVMFVNVASKCGYTPQYEGLEKVYEQYKDKGFVIVGFPANN